MAMATATKKLDTYTWIGRDAKGRTVRGEQEAPNPAYVKAVLRRQGVTPQKVRKQPKPLFEFKTKIKTKEYTHYKEIFHYFAWPALLLLLGGIFLEYTVFRKLP